MALFSIPGTGMARVALVARPSAYQQARQTAVERAGAIFYQQRALVGPGLAAWPVALRKRTPEAALALLYAELVVARYEREALGGAHG